MVIQLGAGLLLLKEYGPESEGTNKDGQMKVDYARGWLKEIAEGTRLLVGASGSEMATSGLIAARGLPNDDEEDPPIITIDEKF